MITQTLAIFQDAYRELADRILQAAGGE